MQMKGEGQNPPVWIPRGSAPPGPPFGKGPKRMRRGMKIGIGA